MLSVRGLGTTCAELAEINTVTVDNPGTNVSLILDDVRFEP